MCREEVVLDEHWKWDALDGTLQHHPSVQQGKNWFSSTRKALKGVPLDSQAQGKKLQLKRGSPMHRIADGALTVTNSPGPDITFGSTHRSQKEMQNKQTKGSKITTHYLIWKQNKGVVCSCTSLKLQLGLYCSLLRVHRVHIRLWAVGFLADDPAASQGSWGLGGGSVQGCACSGISIQYKEVVTEVAVNCCCVGKGWGLLCKQVSSALFQFKVKTSR